MPLTRMVQELGAVPSAGVNDVPAVLAVPAPPELVATAETGWVGATFQLKGSSGASTSSTSSNRASASR
jgi:hypothetical protein